MGKITISGKKKVVLFVNDITAETIAYAEEEDGLLVKCICILCVNATQKDLLKMFLNLDEQAVRSLIRLLCHHTYFCSKNFNVLYLTPNNFILYRNNFFIKRFQFTPFKKVAIAPALFSEEFMWVN